MANYVYTDHNKTIKLYAKNCDSSNLTIKYYCPTPNCNARLTLRSLNGKLDPYFSALKSFPHADFCTIPSTDGKKSEYNLSNFSIESLYNLITSTNRTASDSGNKKTTTRSKGKSESDSINTTSKLYYFCKGHDVNYTVTNQIKVRDLIADSRTNYLFTKGIFGYRLVECKFHRYFDLNHTIELDYPIDPSLKNKHKLKIQFEKDKDYDKILSKIFVDKTNYSTAHIGILGEWYQNSCLIKHWKQIIVVRG